MTSFFQQLNIGVEKTSISTKQQEFITKLTSLNALKDNENIFQLTTSLFIAKIDINQRGIGFGEIYSIKKQKDLLIETRDLNGANKGDIVLLARAYAKSTRSKAKVVSILQTKFSAIVVYLDRVKRKLITKNIKTDQIVPIKASKKSLSCLPIGTILKVDAKTLNIIEVIGVITDPKIDEKISLALYDKDMKFNNSSIIEADAYGVEVDKSLYPNRIDLTHLPFCTIDPKSAKDFDDAIYFDNKTYVLYVAIADVSFYVNEFSSINIDALKRGFSTYLPHKSFPMLPPNLSENICSLKPNVNRLSFVCEMKLDKSLQVENSKFYEAIIYSNNRFTYEQIDNFLETKTIPKSANFVYDWVRVSSSIRKNRLHNGLEFDGTELVMILDDKNNLVHSKEEHSSISHEIVEEAMLLANKSAATKIDKGIYRTHAQPTKNSIRELKEYLSSMGLEVEETDNLYELFHNIQNINQSIIPRNELNKILIKTQQKATYEFDSLPHFGLGFEEYTHFTSPIRRYSDIIVHRILKEDSPKRLNYILKDIDDITNSLNLKERDSTKIEFDFKDRKYSRYLSENIDTLYEAIVIDTKRGGMAKVITGKAIGALIFLDNATKEDLFCTVEIKIREVNIYSAKVYGSI